MYKPVFLLIFLFMQTVLAHGQFVMQGHAAYMDGDCIQLTPDSAYSEGIAFYSTPLNLEHAFSISFDLFLGEKEEGADGLTFVIHDDPRGLQAFGTWGECLGYGRWNADVPYGTYIAPSVAVEFDTYQNLRQNDPENDHIAWLENGSSRHTTSWPRENDSFNLEDGLLHDFVFQWIPEEQTIKVLLDGQVVVNRQQDLLGDIFKGQPMVIWGFTASTGRKYNLQYFCLRRLALAGPE